MLFAAVQLHASSGFWKAVYDLKLNHWRLDASPRPVSGVLKLPLGSSHPVLYLDDTSFGYITSDRGGAGRVVHGQILVYNTVEDFKSAPLQALLDGTAAPMWQAITAPRSEHGSGPVAAPYPWGTALHSFLLLVYADLKEQVFVHWAAFPAMVRLLPGPAASAGGAVGVGVGVGVAVAGEVCSPALLAAPSPLHDRDTHSGDAHSGGHTAEDRVRVSDSDSISVSGSQLVRAVNTVAGGGSSAGRSWQSVLVLQRQQQQRQAPAAVEAAAAEATARSSASGTAASVVTVQLGGALYSVLSLDDWEQSPAAAGTGTAAGTATEAPAESRSGTVQQLPGTIFVLHLPAAPPAADTTSSTTATPTAADSSSAHGPVLLPWTARNVITALCCRYRLHMLPLLLLRTSSDTMADHCSGVLYRLRVQPPAELLAPTAASAAASTAAVAVAAVAAAPRLPPYVSAVGWSLDARGRSPGPRKAILNPHDSSSDSSSGGGGAGGAGGSGSGVSASAAEAAADLNLSLIKWRMLPELNTAAIRGLRVLMLGAGTLACHLARDLLAWGVRTITFVDAGRVSYSNPVRQPLYEFADAGKWKAVAAAESLGRIWPSVAARGLVLSIPMPGHPVSAGAEAARVAADIEQLRREMCSHDVTFLLTDTRESRWLPTLLGAAHRRLVITVGLGFDSLLVQRHGMRSERETATATATATATETETAAQVAEGQQQEVPERLGCYFCNDGSSGPSNSSAHRAMDQQCTVTRPGVAPLASALAAELLVSLLHHPDGAAAAADGPSPLGTPTSTPLGSLPHQIRVFLTHWTPMVLHAAAFPACTACSDAVVAAYHTGADAFLFAVFADAALLERVSGLRDMHAATEAQLQSAATAAATTAAAAAAASAPSPAELNPASGGEAEEESWEDISAM